MPLGMEVGLGPDDFVFDGDPARPRNKRNTYPHPVFDFLAHVYCGHTSRWIKIPLGTEVLGPWRRGVVASVVRRMNELSYPTSGPVSTGMGDRLWAGIPSRYVTSQLGQLSLASLQGC